MVATGVLRHGRPLIETAGLSKQYLVGAQTIHALKDLTISIETGEFVAIMGPSGSGKSTCMHLLGCLLSPTAGSYLFDGEDVSKMAPDALAEIRNAKIGLIFQSFNLLPRATALQNVELPLVYGPVGRRERLARADLALRSVGLECRATHRPTQLSGGEMQRVCIARALVNRPRLVLADEPTGALDSHTVVYIMRLLAQLNANGTTVILVTHDEEVAGYATRKLRFRDGRLIAEEVGQ